MLFRIYMLPINVEGAQRCQETGAVMLARSPIWTSWAGRF